MSSPSPQAGPVEVFISYAHKDEPLVGHLILHLSLLSKQGLIRDWHHREITDGAEWKGQIDPHVETAEVILLLVSADFLASEYCWDVEVRRAVERHDRGEARVFLVILRPCDWQPTPFGHLIALPRDGKPVTTWLSQDEAFAFLASEIRDILRSLTPVAPNAPAPLPTAPVVQTGIPGQIAASDRKSLVSYVSGLSPNDMVLLVALAEGAASHISRNGTVPEQAYELFRWAERPTGPGLEAVRKALDALRDGQIDLATRTGIVLALSKLQPSDMAVLVVAIPGAASHISRNGTVPEQAAQLIQWAESPRAPASNSSRKLLTLSHRLLVQWPAELLAKFLFPTVAMTPVR